MIGRLGTVWWNWRFSLGRWIGGFDSVHRDYFHTSHAWKLWGRGRLRQIASVLRCKLGGGHRWGEWSETVRTCQRRCGSLQFGGPIDTVDAFAAAQDSRPRTERTEVSDPKSPSVAAAGGGSGEPAGEAGE